MNGNKNLSQVSNQVLITGASGFIGSHLVDYMLTEGYDVIGIDEKPGIVVHKNYLYIISNIIDEAWLQYLDNPLSVIIHLAADVGLNQIQKLDTSRIEMQIKATELIVDVANSYSAKVFFSSSSEVYGDSIPGKTCKETDAIRVNLELLPSSIRKRYGWLKLRQEEIIKKRCESFIIGRLFNIVGLRQKASHGMLLPTWIERIKAGQNIQVYHDGTQVRSYCHIDDLCKMVAELLEVSNKQIVNIGNHDVWLVLALAELFKLISRERVEIEVLKDETPKIRTEEIYYRVPDLTLLHSLIEYRSKKTVENAIRELLDELNDELYVF